MRLLLWIPVLAVVLGACQPVQEVEEAPPPSPTPTLDAACDAGDEAFVSRVIPLLWGRKPHGAAEIRGWASMAATHGRETVVRAMTQDPFYLERWHDWVIDAMAVPRLGDRVDSPCYGYPLLYEDDGSLARFLRQNPGLGTSFGKTFNMADVVYSALRQDDLSVAWRANLFARMNETVGGANVAPHELEDNRRKMYGDEFFHFYLNRSLTCMGCHNSEFSVTGDADPALDRTWEIPGLFEKGLLGNSYGIDEEIVYSVFKYQDLVAEETATERPWGMSLGCGVYTHPSLLVEDFLDQEAYFIQELGEAGSVWDVEAFLREGVDSLTQTGLVTAADLQVDGPMAFAYLVAASVVDRVWEEATGGRLTVAHHFPRNQGQRDRLQQLTDVFVTSGFSLRTLLVGITEDVTYNQGAPSSCLSNPYGLDPVFDPWTVSDANPAHRGNGSGDQIHRHSARTLLRSVHDSLGWPQASRFLANGDPLRVLQTDLGAWMRESQPGFNGVDFQGTLTFENTYGACQPPEVNGAGDGCAETPGHAGCASCNCQPCVCTADPYCCEVQWDALCVSMCNSDCGGCGGGLADRKADTVDRLLEAGSQGGATVGEVVGALKDRLVAQASVSPEEQGLIEALIQVPMAQPLAEAADVEPALRVLCGALLMAPEYFLALDPGPAGEVPSLALDVEADCQRVVTLMATEGIQVTCTGGQPL